MTKRIQIVGTYDTKADELGYLAACIVKQGGKVLTMDVSVLGANVELHETFAHINDEAFSNLVLSIFDGWVETGIVKKTKRS